MSSDTTRAFRERQTVANARMATGRTFFGILNTLDLLKNSARFTHPEGEDWTISPEILVEWEGEMRSLVDNIRRSLLEELRTSILRERNRTDSIVSSLLAQLHRIRLNISRGENHAALDLLDRLAEKTTNFRSLPDEDGDPDHLLQTEGLKKDPQTEEIERLSYLYHYTHIDEFKENCQLCLDREKDCLTCRGTGRVGQPGSKINCHICQPFPGTE